MMDSNGFAEGYAVGRDANGNNGNGNAMWGDGSWWIVIILFALIFGWGNNGNYGNGGGNAAQFIPYAIGANGSLTRSDLCSEFNFNNLESSVRGIQQGLCDGFYAMNTGLLNGFNGVDNAICSLGYQTQNGFNATQVAMLQGQNAIQTQLAQCCCDNKTGQMQIQNTIDSCCCRTNNAMERGFADINYNMATNTCALQTTMANNTRDIIDSQRDGTRAILDYLCQEKISDLQNENQTLKLAASQERQNNYLVNTLRPSYITCNPFTGTYGGFGYGYNNSYNNGCNSGCCGCNG